MNFKDVLKQLRFEDQIKFNNITKNQLRVICNISKECSKRGTNWKLIKDSSFVDYLLTAVNKRKGNTHAKILDTKVKVRTINKQVQTVRTYQKKTVLRKRFSLLTPKYKMARISIILQKLKSLVGGEDETYKEIGLVINYILRSSTVNKYFVLSNLELDKGKMAIEDAIDLCLDKVIFKFLSNFVIVMFLIFLSLSQKPEHLKTIEKLCLKKLDKNPFDFKVSG